MSKRSVFFHHRLFGDELKPYDEAPPEMKQNIDAAWKP